MTSGYNRMMASTGFFEARITPRGPAGTSAGGWAFVNEDNASNNNSNSNTSVNDTNTNANANTNSSTDPDEEDDSSLILLMITLILVTVMVVAPVAAAIWLCTQPLTIASALTALGGAVGATTVAATLEVGVTALDCLISGKPFIDIINEQETWTNPGQTLDEFIASPEFQDMLAAESALQ